MKIQLSSLHTKLKHSFGYDTFRPFQEEIIAAILGKRDVLAILPTGSGKSLCYQLPILETPGKMAIVISPLIALMQDQVQVLTSMGISAAFINSQLSYYELKNIQKNLQNYALIYVAPERLCKEEFLDLIKPLNIAYFVIDEAHCISQWGHAFRPEYRQLAILKHHFPQVPIATFTATATPLVQQDIIDQLHLQTPYKAIGSFDRSNLTIRIDQRDNGKDQLKRFLESHRNQSGIIYTTTRKSVDKLYEELKKNGYPITKYHAGLTDSERQKAQGTFLNDTTPIMVATVAFGMGVHKPDVRFVVHMDLPKSFEGYYQEIGRAGRDGLPSDCLMLYSTRDYILQKSMYADIPDDITKHSMLRRLEQFFSFCAASECRRKQILHYFSEPYLHDNCQNCDNCLDDIITEDITIIAQKILSCVYRMQQRFGIQRVVDVLAGSQTQEIIQNRFDKLSTYGLLSDLPRLDIRHYIFSLINQNFLAMTEGQYPILQLTVNARSVLKKTTPVFVRKRVIKVHKERKKSEKSHSNTVNRNMLAKLKEVRKQLASKAGLPPYMIFHDKHLVHMAELQPKNEAEFYQVQGVGEQKHKLYSKAFLECIASCLS